MITLTRLNGMAFALNPDLFERVDCTPDTIITLVDGQKYVVEESIEEVVATVRAYRRSLIADAARLGWSEAADATPVARRRLSSVPSTSFGSNRSGSPLHGEEV